MGDGLREVQQHFQNIDADAAGFDDADAVAGLGIDDLLEAEAVDPDIEEDLTDYFDIRVKRRMASRIWQELSTPKKNLWLQHNPRVQNFKILFTRAHLRLISTYSLVQILRALLETNQIFNNTDHHGISYVFHRLS